LLTNLVKCFLTYTAQKKGKKYNKYKNTGMNIERSGAMSKNVTVKNYDRFIRLGIAIAALRKIRGLSQEKLAEKAGISRSLMSVIEAPNTAHSFSMEVFFDIADALAVDPADLLNATIFPDSVLKNDNSDLHGEKK
jgi:transcriptional regulator, XRE family